MNLSAWFVAAVMLYLLAVNGLISPSEAANCSTVTCANGGTCNNFTASPPCICPLPFIAPYCNASADYCRTLQADKGINELPVCNNGGNCTMIFTDPYFNCDCPPGYAGLRCSEVQQQKNETTSQQIEGLTTVHIVLIVVCPILLIFIIIFFIFVWYCRKAKSDDASQ